MKTFPLGRTVSYIALCIATLFALVPFFWLLSATLKPTDEMFSHVFLEPTKNITTGAWEMPKISLQNFSDLFFSKDMEKYPYGRYLINSVFITCTTVCLQLFFSSLAGFALAKYEFKGKKIIMFIMLATMMIPGQVTLAPSYELLYKMHLVDTHAGLLIPAAVNVFGIFLFRQAIMGVPDELLQAARIDGCSEFRIYWDIIMPVVRPMIGAFCLLTFMGTWNSFLWPQILLHTNELFTGPIGLSQLIGIYSQKYGMMMAGTLLFILPVMALFFALQKEFVAGLTSGAVKG